MDSSVRGVSLRKNERWTRFQSRLRLRAGAGSVRDFFPREVKSLMGSRSVGGVFDIGRLSRGRSGLGMYTTSGKVGNLCSRIRGRLKLFRRGEFSAFKYNIYGYYICKIVCFLWIRFVTPIFPVLLKR